MLEQLFEYNTDFRQWTAEHYVPVILFTLLGYALIYMGLYRWNDIQKRRYPFYISLLLPFSVVLWIILRLARGEFDINDDLPFHLCNLITFFLPFIFMKKRPILFGVFYYWVMAGTLQAVITPGIEQSPPHYWYFRYWLVHCGLVIFALYGIIVLKYRPTLKQVWWAFLAMNILFVITHSFNLIADTNYLYTIKKPPNASLVDYFGPWPWYILVSEFVGLFFFFLYYLPFWYLKRKEQRS